MRPRIPSSYSQPGVTQTGRGCSLSLSQELMQTSWPRVSHPQPQRKGEGLQVQGASERT